jgi:hypothetical protein
MKKITIMALLSVSLVSASSLSHDEITNMISKIKEERVGIALSKLENTSNPFIIIKKEKAVQSVEKAVEVEVRQEVEYKLHAILNHAAFINGKWYKRGDKLGVYQIVYIGKKSVDLTSEFGKKTLSIKKRNNKLFKLNKGKK